MANPRVFISYAREDLKQVKKLKEFLKKNNIDPWLDVDEILPGEKWRIAISKGLSSSDFIIVCLSQRSVTKRGFVQRELRIALDALEEMLDSDIYLIPVRFDDCEVPQKLSELQWIDLFSQGGDEKLVRAVHEGFQRRMNRETLSSQGSSVQKDNSQKSESERDIPDLSQFGGANAIDSLSWARILKKKNKK